MAKRCFVISPIGQPGSDVRHHADDVFEYIIKPATVQFDLVTQRADFLSESGRITQQMFREIFAADLCVVVLTGFNPNVFYELAVAQCVARPCILLIEKGHVLPFDVKDLRTIEYRLQPISDVVAGRYTNEVAKHIKSIEGRGWIEPSLYQQFQVTPQLKSEQQLRHLVDMARPEPLPEANHDSFCVPGDRERQICIDSGDLLQVERLDADVVVSPESTDLQLGRFYDDSISGKLRYLDATRTKGGHTVDDCLAESLRAEIQRLELKLPVRTAPVIATPTHGLESLGIKRVFHVAALDGRKGVGYEMEDHVIEESVRNSFRTFELLAPDVGLRSMLFPMLGAYSSGLGMFEVARRMMKAVTRGMESTPACKTVRLLAWHESQLDALQHVASEQGLQRAGV